MQQEILNLKTENAKLLRDNESLNRRLARVEDLFYRINQIDKFELDKPLIIRKFKIPLNQLSDITDPTGGAVVDAEARTAVNSLIDRLQEIGLIG